ncbi:MAG: hypothetical protein PHH13_02855 [Candidatus Peribacteraceae bacterium]|nr:hypothetical protein [Candidatus Peribacteraceae bacterium]
MKQRDRNDESGAGMRDAIDRAHICGTLTSALSALQLKWGEGRMGRSESTREGAFNFGYSFLVREDPERGMLLRLSSTRVGMMNSGIRFSENTGMYDFGNLTVEVSGNGGAVRAAIDSDGFCFFPSNSIRHGSSLVFRVSNESTRDVPVECLQRRLSRLANGTRGSAERLLRSMERKAVLLARRHTHQMVKSVLIPWADALRFEEAASRAEQEQMEQWRLQFPKAFVRE